MSNIYFYLIVTFAVADFVWEQLLSYLNRTRMTPTMPKELEGIYDPAEYARQQTYPVLLQRILHIQKTSRLFNEGA